MSFVAVAIGGAAVVGAGASIYSGSQQAKGAEGVANAAGQANQTLVSGQNRALEQLAPYQQSGQRARNALESMLYSPEQRQEQAADVAFKRDKQRRALEYEVQQLQAQVSSAPQSSNNVFRGTAVGNQTGAAQSVAQQQLAIAQQKLNQFTRESQHYQEQFDRPAPEISASPFYEFQAQLLGRNMDRFNAARGLTGSGFEAEERRTGLLQLGAEETERQFGRLKGLYDVGANAANVASGSLTGTSQSIANNQIAQGQAMAGVAGANANMATGIANSASGAVGAGLNYAQFQNLIAANQPTQYSRTPLPKGDWLQTAPS